MSLMEMRVSTGGMATLMVVLDRRCAPRRAGGQVDPLRADTRRLGE